MFDPQRYGRMASVLGDDLLCFTDWPVIRIKHYVVREHPFKFSMEPVHYIMGIFCFLRNSKYILTGDL